MTWLEISLVVNGELAEAVADVLARFAYSGVMMEQGVKYKDEEDAGTPAGPITVRAYLEMDDKIEETRQKLEESLYYLGMIQPIPAPTYKQIADQNWMEAWKQHYKPILIGKRLVIVPAWMDTPDPARVAIKIDPGMAFGTGTHPSTQLCLELMEKEFAVQPPLRMIDVGCGSGILSIAAIKLGSLAVLGVDIDAGSIMNSRENADANQVGEELTLAVGSVEEIRAGRFVFNKAPIVVANILAPVIVRLFETGLAELIEDRGVIILSGILQDQAERVIDAGQLQGLVMKEKRQMGDWIALAMSPVL